MSLTSALNSPWKKEFPLFCAEQHATNEGEEKVLHYLDSAATCLIPQSVVKATTHYLQFEHANSHRGFYALSTKLTQQIEDVRHQVSHFINAPSADNVIFTHGTTSAIHQIAHGYVAPKLKRHHNIIVSVTEHHANFLPWQQLAEKTGAQLKILPLDASGKADLNTLTKLIDDNTLLIAVTHLSNVLGTINPIEDIVDIAKQSNVKVLVDGAQYAGCYPLDIQALGCDFYVFSGHKIYAGNGCGVLFATNKCLDDMEPVVLGGGMVERVSIDTSRWQAGNRRFEAGTLNAQAIIALGAAIEFLMQARASGASEYLHQLANYLHQQLLALDFIKPLISDVTPNNIFSFNVKGVHSHDIAAILSEQYIAARAGHHCAQPLHQALGVNSSVRVSLGVYNEAEDIDKLVHALTSAQQLLG